MAVRTKIESKNLDYNLIFKDLTSPAEVSRAFAEQAAVIIEDVKAQNARILGRVPRHTISVDGREGAPLTSVRPNGVIFVEFELVFEVIEWIGDMLRRHSPVKSGRYQDSHVLLADDVAVEPGAVPPIAERYAWVNVQPYARKIERGLSSQAPSGVYQSVATMASSTQRFGNVARIKFGYITPLFGAIDAWANTPSAARWAKLKSKRREALHAEWLRRQPAIIITLPG